MIYLDANDNNQVDSARVIEVMLNEADRKMMIFSGIARPSFLVNDDENRYTEDVVVNLRKTVLAVDQFTVSIGLASIGNADTVFLIAADTGTIDIDQQSQELLLKVKLVLQGEGTHISRFGYQVVTTVTTQTTGISGAIRWSRNLFDGMKLSAGQIAQTFKIAANTVERISPPGGFQYDKLTPVAPGVTSGLGHDRDDFVVPYSIPGAPYNKQLTVTVDVGALFTTNGTPFAGQTSGPKPVVLTLGSPGISGVDFRVQTITIH